jgi:hypothetical protein
MFLTHPSIQNSSFIVQFCTDSDAYLDTIPSADGRETLATSFHNVYNDKTSSTDPAFKKQGSDIEFMSEFMYSTCSYSNFYCCSREHNTNTILLHCVVINTIIGNKYLHVRIHNTHKHIISCLISY